MRDKTHMEQVEAWARYVREHKDWKKIHTAFINAQYEKAQEFIRRLALEPDGAQKIIKLYRIRNLKGYEGLLKNSKV